MSDTSLISIIIPTYNREEVLCQTLQLLSQQSYPNYEIIVVDQTPAHQPETDAFLRDQQAAGHIRYYRLEKPSLPEARNFGVRQARGEIVLFLDDDVIPDPGLVAVHMREHQQPGVGGVGGRHTDPASIACGDSPIRTGFVKRNGESVAGFSSTVPQPSVEWISGCHSSFPIDLIREAGHFEPRFIGSAAYEEIDFCFRLRRRGYRLVFTPDSFHHHLAAGAGGCGNRVLDERFYFGLVHNSLLFAFRNMKVWDWPFVVANRLAMSLALVKQRRSLRYIGMFLHASFLSVISYFKSLRSLNGRTA